MEFGLFFEISVPRPLTRVNERRAIYDTLEQARLADELGFDRVWVVEHHFLEEYSHSSAPELMLTAIAMQTERIRIGHGAVVCIPQINHPVRVAERAAFLDVLSRGRLDVGTARSSTWTELGGFGVAPDHTKASWDEFVHALPRMWTEERFNWDGCAFSMPERSILPKPYQDPHPPMWVAVTSPGTELDAARRGMGCLGVSAASFSSQEKIVRNYREVIRNCEPAGKRVTNEVAAMNFLYCHEDKKTADAVGHRLLRDFNYLNTHCLWNREAYPSGAYKSLTNLAPGKGSGISVDDPGVERPLPEGVAMGDPAEIIRALKLWETTGVDSVNFLLNSTDTISQQDVLASLRLFAREVMPSFRRKAAEAA